MLCILPLLPVRLTACERRQPPCGEAALAAVLERFVPFEAPAPAWAADLLPAHLSHCDPTGSTAFACPARGYGDGAVRAGRGRDSNAAHRRPSRSCGTATWRAWEAITTFPEPVPPLSPAAKASSAPSHPVQPHNPLAPRSPETPEHPETRLLGPMKGPKVPDSRPRTRMFDSSRTQ